MRMDLCGTRYETMADLRLYSYRVAGVIGEWLTRMCGITDPWMLERAACLGHAMQLTNILRDVGEDLERGRVYLPAAVLREYSISHAQLQHAAAGGRRPRGYIALMERLMARADADYAAAMEAAPRLPAYFRRAIVVAAHVYRGIHSEIRGNGYDNLRRRAHTSGMTKLRLALSALRGRRIGDAGDVVHPIPLHLHQPQPQRLGRAARHGAGAALLAALLLPIWWSVSMPAEAEAVKEQVAMATGNDLRTPTEYARQLEAQHAARPSDGAIMLDLARALFFVGVDNSAVVPRGAALLEQVRTRAPDVARSNAAVLQAYHGAFTMLEAKHGSWPPSRMRAVRMGLRQLDDAVAAAPADVEIRYLRLVNTHYLPGIFGRKDTARQDRTAVQQLIAAQDANLHPALRSVIAEFLRTTAS
jgi:hypothetical protein